MVTVLTYCLQRYYYRGHMRPPIAIQVRVADCGLHYRRSTASYGAVHFYLQHHDAEGLSIHEPDPLTSENLHPSALLRTVS